MQEKHKTLKSIESKQINGIPNNIWETDCDVTAIVWTGIKAIEKDDA